MTALEERNQLIVDNLGLAGKFAKRYDRVSGVGYDELFQCACVGLCCAADKFDARRGYKFCTYSVPWIKKFILARIHKRHSLIVAPPLFGKALDDILGSPRGALYLAATKSTSRLTGATADCLADKSKSGFDLVDDRDEAEAALQTISIPKERHFIRVRYGIGCNMVGDTKNAAKACGIHEDTGHHWHKKALRTMSLVREES